MTNARAAQTRKVGTPGPEGSVAKLAFAEENKRVYDLCMDLLGSEAMLFPAGYPMVRPDQVGMGSPDVHKLFLACARIPLRAGPPRSCATFSASGCWPPRRRPHGQGTGLEGRPAELSATST